jgi:hypothetical protein
MPGPSLISRTRTSRSRPASRSSPIKGLLPSVRVQTAQCVTRRGGRSRPQGSRPHPPPVGVGAVRLGATAHLCPSSRMPDRHYPVVSGKPVTARVRAPHAGDSDATRPALPSVPAGGTRVCAPPSRRGHRRSLRIAARSAHVEGTWVGPFRRSALSERHRRRLARHHLARAGKGGPGDHLSGCPSGEDSRPSAHTSTTTGTTRTSAQSGCAPRLGPWPTGRFTSRRTGYASREPRWCPDRRAGNRRRTRRPAFLGRSIDDLRRHPPVAASAAGVQPARCAGQLSETLIGARVHGVVSPSAAATPMPWLSGCSANSMSRTAFADVRTALRSRSS